MFLTAISNRPFPLELTRLGGKLRSKIIFKFLFSTITPGLLMTMLLAHGIYAANPAPSTILPASDPAPKSPPVHLLPGAAGQHPRLLFSARDVARLRKFYYSPAGAIYRQRMRAYLPSCVIPADRKLTHAWGQTIGLMKMPTVALHYLITGDRDSFNKSVAYLKWLASTANWSEGGEPPVPDTPAGYAAVMKKLFRMKPEGETNSDTTAAFTMVGAALTYDWLYNDLDPTFRKEFRQVLWQHARAMYWGGHMGRNPGGNYWRHVPMYNHRWYRDWGLTLAVLAATRGKPNEQWMLQQLVHELAFMADWLPADGSDHEGPGYGSSAGDLAMAFFAADRCLGTHFLDQPYFRNLGMWALEESAPGMHQAIYYADSFDKALSLNPFFLRVAAYFHESEILAGLRHYLKVNLGTWGLKQTVWAALVSDYQQEPGGDWRQLPTTAIFPDLGLVIVRDNWDPNAVAAMFKCGPPGGYKLNSWRVAAKAQNGDLPYANVAHDHPDANSFVIIGDGHYMAETDRYSQQPGKLSSSLNTILINGIGQAPPGQPEGQVWLQPSAGDMTHMGVITAWKDAGDVVVAEGEASGSYRAYTDTKSKTSRPGLDLFRRTFIWVKGGYILILDDIRAPRPVKVTWLVQGAKLKPLAPAQGRWRLSKDGAQCDFQLLADQPFITKIGVSTANDSSKLMNWQQLRASAETTAIRFVSIYNPWHHTNLQLTFTPNGPDRATITVKATGIEDTWNWQTAPGRFVASSLHGWRKGGFDVRVNARDAAPPSWEVPPGWVQ